MRVAWYSVLDVAHETRQVVDMDIRVKDLRRLRNRQQEASGADAIHLRLRVRRCHDTQVIGEGAEREGGSNNADGASRSQSRIPATTCLS